MPVSKQGKSYYTQEQYDIAKHASALEYARRHGYTLVPSGQRYYLAEHDSMVFLPDGRWYWNSRGMHGRAFEFVRCYEGKNTVDAVLAIAGESDTLGPIPIQKATKKETEPFALPPADHFELGVLIKYLTQRRALDTDIVRQLIHDRRIYISCQRTANGNGVIRNAVFVGFDDDGVPRFASLRGINYGSHFKGAVPGGNKTVPFEVPSVAGATRLAVFEAPIDAISHATLEKKEGKLWQHTARLALGGNPAPHTISGWLEKHQEIHEVIICFDADLAGRKLDEIIRQELDTFHGTISTIIPPYGKDWNEFLCYGKEI